MSRTTSRLHAGGVRPAIRGVMNSEALESVRAGSGSPRVGTSVLFVCTGNMCRSPVAERIVRSLAIPGVHAESAGTQAAVGAKIDDTMREILEGDGIETSDFRARQFTAAMAERHDIIVTGASEHRSVVLREAPNALRRTFTLREIADLTELAELEGPLEPLTRPSRLTSLVRLRASRPPDALDDILDPHLLSEAHYRRVYEVVAGTLRGPVARLLTSFTK